MKRDQKEIDSAINRIEQLDKLLIQLSEYFTKIKHKSITRENIFDALYLSLKDRFQWEHPLDFWDLDIAYEEACATLSTFDFRTVLHKIETERNIIPKDLLINYKVQIKSKGLIWLIHIYDSDPFPSSPHAHEMSSGLKLDLRNGRCYKRKQLVHSIKKRDLLLIRKEAEKHFNLPELEI